MKTLSILLVLAFGLCRSFGQAYPVPPGLVSWWPGQNSALDVYGTNNGTWTGTPQYVGGEVGNAFFFDGATSYVTITNYSFLLQQTNFTVEFWMCGTNIVTDNSFYYLIGRGRASLDPWTIRRSGTTAGAIYDFTTSGGSAEFEGALLAFNGTTNHMAMVISGTNFLEYFDGALINSNHLPGTISSTDETPLSFGGPASIGSTLYKGMLDEVSYYGRALTAAEILSIYNAGPSGKTTNAPPVFSPSLSPAWYMLL
jgi:hypothetical protein